MPFRWSGRDTQTLSAVAMSALLLASAAKHFDDPGFFAPVVPDFLCRDDTGERPTARSPCCPGRNGWRSAACWRPAPPSGS